MKKILLATVAFAALGMVPAGAADLAARTYTKAPAMAPLPSWAGFYIGAHGWLCQPKQRQPVDQGRFRWRHRRLQLAAGSVVYGLEADAAWADINASVTGAVVVPGVGPVGLTVTDKIDSTGTVRGRIGYAFDTVLLYGTGGYAWADNKLSISALGVTTSTVQGPERLDRRCRRRAAVRSEVVGQGRIPLQELRQRDLLRRFRPATLAHHPLRPGRRELSLLSAPGRKAERRGPPLFQERRLFLWPVQPFVVPQFPPPAARCRHCASVLLMIRARHWKSVAVLPTFQAYFCSASDVRFPAERA